MFKLLKLCMPIWLVLSPTSSQGDDPTHAFVFFASLLACSNLCKASFEDLHQPQLTGRALQWIVASQPLARWLVMWAEMALQLQLNMGPMSSYPHLALEKMVRESSGACMITVEKGYWSPCMRETWMPHVNICGDDGCDVHSTGTGVCSVRVDGAAYSLTHCGVFPAPAVNQAQGKDVHLFCPAAVPIAVFPILKCASGEKVGISQTFADQGFHVKNAFITWIRMGISTDSCR